MKLAFAYGEEAIEDTILFNDFRWMWSDVVMPDEKYQKIGFCLYFYIF